MPEFDFPDDLLELQRRFFAAEAAWVKAAGAGDEEAVSRARQTAQDAAVALHRHPFMTETENRFQVRMALREAARG